MEKSDLGCLGKGQARESKRSSRAARVPEAGAMVLQEEEEEEEEETDTGGAPAEGVMVCLWREKARAVVACAAERVG